MQNIPLSYKRINYFAYGHPSTFSFKEIIQLFATIYHLGKTVIAYIEHCENPGTFH